MDVQVHVDAEAVNKMVADAILKSALGKQIEEAIKRQISSLSTSYNNPLDAEISRMIASIAREQLQAEHGETIRKRITTALAIKLTDEFIDRVVEKAADRYS